MREINNRVVSHIRHYHPFVCESQSEREICADVTK